MANIRPWFLLLLIRKEVSPLSIFFTECVLFRVCAPVPHRTELRRAGSLILLWFCCCSHAVIKKCCIVMGFNRCSHSWRGIYLPPPHPPLLRLIWRPGILVKVSGTKMPPNEVSTKPKVSKRERLYIQHILISILRIHSRLWNCSSGFDSKDWNFWRLWDFLISRKNPLLVP